jgi:hypothetical protein
MAVKRIKKPKPLRSAKPKSESEKPLGARVQIEEIHDPALAADMCRRILRAQARTAADEEREKKEREANGDRKTRI